MEVLTYVPSNVTLLLTGYQVEGWDSITITQNSPVFKQIRGIRGKNTRSRLVDTSATITISVPQTEPINEVLSKCLEVDIQTGSVRLDIALMDVTGTGFFNTTTGYVVSYPEIKYSNGISTNEWTLACDESRLFVGMARSAAVGMVGNGVGRLRDFVNDIL